MAWFYYGVFMAFSRAASRPPPACCLIRTFRLRQSSRQSQAGLKLIMTWFSGLGPVAAWRFVSAICRFHFTGTALCALALQAFYADRVCVRNFGQQSRPRGISGGLQLLALILGLARAGTLAVLARRPVRFGGRRRILRASEHDFRDIGSRKVLQVIVHKKADRGCACRPPAALDALSILEHEGVRGSGQHQRYKQSGCARDHLADSSGAMTAGWVSV